MLCEHVIGFMRCNIDYELLKAHEVHLCAKRSHHVALELVTRA
jgi:hypothetical protein